MGVEKLVNAPLNKTNFIDIYRPPALRNNSTIDVQDVQPVSLIQIVSSASNINYENNIDEKQTVVDKIYRKNSTSKINYSSTITISDNSSEKITATQRQSTVARRERRPDRAVYIPRARRSQTTPPTTTALTVAETVNTVSDQQQLAINSFNQTAVLVANLALSNADNMLAAESPLTTKIKKSKTNQWISSNKEKKHRCKKSVLVPDISAVPKLDHAIEPNVILIAKSNQDKYSYFATTNCSTSANNPLNCDKNDSAEVITEQKMEAHRTAMDDKEDDRTIKISSAPLHIEDASGTDVKSDNEVRELQRASKEINRSNRHIIKQSFVSNVLEIPEKIVSEPTVDASVLSFSVATSANCIPQNNAADEENNDEDDWENMYDESGECLDPKIMQELTESVGKVKIELPKMNYNDYVTKQLILNDEEFPHVLEVSNFPVEFKNQDLLMVFSQYKESGFDIKWVDDTHALAVFSSSHIAAEVLSMGHPFVVVKPLAEATIESRLKAKKCAASLQPYKPRPETCAALARRLVTGALGVRLKTAAEEREKEKRVLREAKERKLLAAKLRDEAWES